MAASICGRSTSTMVAPAASSLGSGLGHALRNFRGQALGVHEAAHHADAHARDILLACSAEAGLHVLRRAVQGVMPHRRP